jgi:hypothetical protein
MYVFTEQKKVHKARQQYVWRRTLRKKGERGVEGAAEQEKTEK